MLRRSFFVAAALVAATLLTTSTAGAAVRPFNPPQTVVGGCEANFLDAVVTTGGSLRGFATCPTTGTIRFFSRSATGTVNPSETTGFSGNVAAVTYDSTATYVLFMVGHDVRVGKRTNAGAYSSRTVDTFTGAMFPYGDIIARDGSWFGVWVKGTGVPGESTRLYSGGSTIPVTQVTGAPASATDTLPTMAYSASTPVLIWTRITSPDRVWPSALMVTKYVSGTWQPARVFASAGSSNFRPDMQVAAGVTFVTWERDGAIILASNVTGTFTTHAFATPDSDPQVGVSVTGSTVDHVFLAAHVSSPTANRAFFAETASSGSVTGTWDGATLAPPVTPGLAVGGFATKATVVYGSANSVFARTQA